MKNFEVARQLDLMGDDATSVRLEPRRSATASSGSHAYADVVTDWRSRFRRMRPVPAGLL